MSEPRPPSKKQVNIELPSGLDPRYANFVLITHSAAEIILDFAQILPRTPKGKVQSRILMTPMHAKLLHTALGQNLSQYEAKFGAIQTFHGPTLADELFKQVPPTDEE